jgi:hypothetical protein
MLDISCAVGLILMIMPSSQNAISKQMMDNWEPWEKSMQKSGNPRMLQQLTLHSQQIIKATSTQDLDPRSSSNHDHPSILPFEMHVIDPGETPSPAHSEVDPFGISQSY